MEIDDIKFKLDSFEGPLDLLLHLIAKNKVSIYDIPISIIFSQYMEYIKSWQSMNMDIAGAYNYSMASNYNRIPRPPVVMLHEGKPYVAVRRETYEDLVRNDIL